MRGAGRSTTTQWTNPVGKNLSNDEGLKAKREHPHEGTLKL